MRRCLPLAVVCSLVTLLTTPVLAEGDGQADLDKATEVKISIQNPRDLAGLTRVIDLVESAMEKGLDEANAEFAKQMLISSLFERGSLRASALLARPTAALRRDPAWSQQRLLALGDLGRATEMDASLAEAYLLIGRLQTLPLGDPGAARRALTKFIDSESDQITPDQRAQAYALRGATQSDPAKQAADYDKAIETTPEKAEYYLLRGQAHLRAEEYDLAMTLVDKAVELKPGSHAVYVLQGMVLRGLEKTDEAIAAFDKATEINPQAVEPYQYRGELYANGGDKEKAIAELTKAIELAPSNLASPLIRAELYAATEQYENALRDVESVLVRNPGLVRAHLMRTTLLGRLGREAEAIAILEKLAEAAPDQPQIQLQLAGYYMDSGSAEQAIDAFSKVIEKSGENAVVLRMRGDMYLSIGEHKKALDDFAKSYALEPDDSGLLNNYAWTLATSPFDDLRDGDRAIELATKACELTDFKAAHILSTLAAAYAESGDFAKAVEWSQKAVKRHAEDTEKTRDMSADLAAELDSYQAKRPWRELQKEGIDSATEPEEPVEEPAPVTPSLDF